MDDTTNPTRCPRCGASLPAETPEGLCPACLFAIAASPPSSVTTETRSPLSELPDWRGTSRERTSLTPGQVFGPYHIERLLGRGGMGDVYEAEHIEQGRRVALKVLNRRLADAEDRARFLREGQLAASINHPHSVYIFGSEEIDGTPTIAMELLPGGTLKDRVRDHGPLPPAEAVDAVLQVIAGLDAMHAAGVLHRDIKPANCFVDGDGTVKVGDFGLSISTIARDLSQLTATGTFHGTPQFAPPEQFKGDPLDVRADIYAVSATLYYLLTGQPPFDDRDLLALVTRIASDPPRPPRDLAPAVPRALEAVVLRGLAKDRAQRPWTYAALHDALRPFSSAAPTPAPIGPRFIAGVIDEISVMVPLSLFNLSLTTWYGPLFAPWWRSIIPFAMWIAYFGISEGVWGASIGKRLMKLRVVLASGGQRPGVTRAFGRALMFHAPFFVPALLPLMLGQTRTLQLLSGSPLLAAVPTLGAWILVALLFCTARRRNGFAGVHEIGSGTRVVRLEEGRRPSLVKALERTMRVETSGRGIGPFDVLDTLARTESGTLLTGFDPRLRRRVWLHELPPDTPSVAPLIRDLNRPGRLRWLGGRRTASENWDAYEAPDGGPLVALCDRPQPWDVVRRWLVDLAREIDAGLSDGSLGPLALDRLWITGEGRARLLDFRAPGAPIVPTSISPASAKAAQTFLGEVARCALTGHVNGSSTDVVRRPRHALPMSASALLDALDRGAVDSWSDVVRRVTALLNGPARVQRRRRAATLALSAAIPVGVVLLGSAFSAVVMPAMARAISPEIEELSHALNELSMPVSRDRAVDRAALETYIAGRFGPKIADPQFWADPLIAGFLGRHRLLIERIAADHPHVSPDQMAAATAALGPFLERQARLQGALRAFNPWTTVLLYSPVHVHAHGVRRHRLRVPLSRRLAVAGVRHRRGHARRSERLERAGGVACACRLGLGDGALLVCATIRGSLVCTIPQLWNGCRHCHGRGGHLSRGRRVGRHSTRTWPAGSHRRHLSRPAMTERDVAAVMGAKRPVPGDVRKRSAGVR